MKKTEKEREPKSDTELDRIQAEFDRAMNTPSPNPRYGGLTPIEALRGSVKRTQKQEAKKSESDFKSDKSCS